MLFFKSINIDGNIREWKFSSVKELEDVWRSADADIPANDDPIFDVIIDEKEVMLGESNSYPENLEDEDKLGWFEDLLTYVGIDIWQ